MVISYQTHVNEVKFDNKVNKDVYYNITPYYNLLFTHSTPVITSLYIPTHYSL